MTKTKRILTSLALGGAALAAAGLASAQSDSELRSLIKAYGLKGDAILSRKDPIPPMNDPLVQLGKALFYAKSMSPNGDVACVSCHHPFFGFGDNLALPIGVDAENPDLLGPGRKRKKTDPGQTPGFGPGDPPMPRNSPTLIGLGFWDESITWDGTVWSETGTPGTSGVDGRILAPIDTPPVRGMYTHQLLPRFDWIKYEDKFDIGMPLSAGHGMFPASVNPAMRGRHFGAVLNAPEAPSGTDLDVRKGMAARIGNYGSGAGFLKKNEWLPLFRAAYKDPNGSAEKLVTPNKISIAISTFERTMTFTNTPWKAYVQGKDDALSPAAKRGALLFYKPIEQGGAYCVSCHRGDFFTDEKYWVLAMPQFGRGKFDFYNADDANDDWGRGHVTGDRNDKYAYRTPTLLGVEVTPPFSHAGAYNTLEEVIKHHLNAEAWVKKWDPKDVTKEGGPINFRFSKDRTERALEQLKEHRAAGKKGVLRDVNLNDAQVGDLVEFMKALTDPCLKDRQCLAQWIPGPTDPDPDGTRICAVDKSGKPLWGPSCTGAKQAEAPASTASGR